VLAAELGGAEMSGGGMEGTRRRGGGAVEGGEGVRGCMKEGGRERGRGGRWPGESVEGGNNVEREGFDDELAA